MHDEAAIRDLLIESCHSSKEAVSFFVEQMSDPEFLSLLMCIALDEYGYLGDAPMQAAYFVSQFPGELLAPHEAALFELLPQADGYGGHVALALAKTKSERGKQAILTELGDGSRFDAWLFKEALAEYEGP